MNIHERAFGRQEKVLNTKIENNEKQIATPSDGEDLMSADQLKQSKERATTVLAEMKATLANEEKLLSDLVGDIYERVAYQEERGEEIENKELDDLILEGEKKIKELREKVVALQQQMISETEEWLKK